MARPRRSDAKREELLLLGIKLFSDHGYHGTGLKLILDSGKVPKGSFYNYFSSKENFGAEAVRRYSEHLLAAIKPSPSEDPLDMIARFHEMLLAPLQADGAPSGCLLGALSAEVGSEPGELQDALQAGFDAWQNVYTSLFEQAQEAGSVRRDISAEQLSRGLLSVWQGSLQRFQLDRSAADLTQSVQTFLKMSRSCERTA